MAAQNLSKVDISADQSQRYVLPDQTAAILSLGLPVTLTDTEGETYSVQLIDVIHGPNGLAYTMERVQKALRYLGNSMHAKLSAVLPQSEIEELLSLIEIIEESIELPVR